MGPALLGDPAAVRSNKPARHGDARVCGPARVRVRRFARTRGARGAAGSQRRRPVTRGEPCYLIERALQHKRDGELHEAEELLLDVIERSKTLPGPAQQREVWGEAHWALAWVYADGGNGQEAAEHFRKVIEFDTDPEETREAQAALERIRSQP